MHLPDDMSCEREDEKLSTTKSSEHIDVRPDSIEKSIAISTSKEEIKQRIYDQANRVKNVFSDINVSEQTKLAMRDTSQKQRSSQPIDSRALSHFRHSLGEMRSLLDGSAANVVAPPHRNSAPAGCINLFPGTTEKMNPNASVKRQKLDPSTRWSLRSFSADFAFDESLIREEILSPGKEDYGRPSSTPPGESSFTSSSPLKSPIMLKPPAKSTFAPPSPFPSPGLFDPDDHEEQWKPEKKSDHAYKLEARHVVPRKSDSAQLAMMSNSSQIDANAWLRPSSGSNPDSKMTFNNNDVVFDTRGTITQNTVGNRRLSILFDLYQNSYSNATSTVERFGTAQKIVNAIREAFPPGRVIKMDQKTGQCSIVTDEVATRVIERALAGRVGCKSFGGQVA